MSELKRLKKRELYTLAGFYDVKINRSMSKADIIDAIASVAVPNVSKPQEIQRSVRVQRIYDLRAQGKQLP